MPKLAALNLDPSALPKFRGAAPLQRTIMSGDRETEICIINMTEKLDAGDIYLKKLLDDQTDFGELHDKTAKIGADLMLEVIDNFENLIATPQQEEGLSLKRKLRNQNVK